MFTQSKQEPPAMDLLTRFVKNTRSKNLFSKNDKLLLAVSGGIDSVVLAELCRQAGFDFIIAHCNFGLRGAESDRDEQFVWELGKKYGVPTRIERFDTEKFAGDNKLSIQEAAREIRYDYFRRLLETESARYIVTAHHADDNAETVLMNFCRGTGLQGLTGIPESTPKIRRPLLVFTKEELAAFASENKLDHVEDSSNLTEKYTRNFFRNSILPMIGNVYPQVMDNLQDNISRFREIEILYRDAVGEFKKKLLKQKGREVHIPVKQLMKFRNRALLYEIIHPYGFTEKQVDEFIKLADAGSGKYMESPGHGWRVIRHRHWFIIAPVTPGESETIIVEEKDRVLDFPGGRLQFDMISGQPVPPGREIRANNMEASLDTSSVSYPLLLRKWKTGDYFYPLGMKKKKKLSRFFIDQKLSRTEKENVWVLESEKRIIWVLGHRIDERCRVTPATRSFLRVRFSIPQTG